MDFDAVISAVVPAGFLADVQDILVGMNFTSILASQAWELCRRLVVVVVVLSSVCSKFICEPHGLTIDLTLFLLDFLGLSLGVSP